jgi:hypothetical protein
MLSYTKQCWRGFREDPARELPRDSPANVRGGHCALLFFTRLTLLCVQSETGAEAGRQSRVLFPGTSGAYVADFSLARGHWDLVCLGNFSARVALRFGVVSRNGARNDY